jgi:glycosyltransferase involved in cell wall biosynthesis
VALWTERDEPRAAPTIQIPTSTEHWCAQTQGELESIAELERWSPSVIIVNGLVNPAIEDRLMRIAPAVSIAHTYYGTCISGAKTMTLPRTQACERRFGPACLALFYPRRCGGLNPLTLLKDYDLHRARLALMRSYRLVLVLSEHMRTEYLRHGLSPGVVRTMPPYLSTDVPRARNRETSREVVTLLYLGRIDRLKGCHLLLESLPQVAQSLRRRVRLVVGGDGADRAVCERLAQRVRAADVDVDFRGWLGTDARSAALSEADVLVLPSLWPEPYGLSGLEAVAAGVPVAAFRTGGVPEWLHGDRGRLASADPPTADGLAAAIVECCDLGVQPPLAISELTRQRARHTSAVMSCLDEIAAV